MPHEEQREKNIRLVTEKALDCFLENGIEKTKIADIAGCPGLPSVRCSGILKPRRIWFCLLPCCTGTGC